MDLISELQKWYLDQCNDNWEHGFGIEIGNIDNPGWTLKIDLVDTTLENVPFEEKSYGIGIDADSSGNEWLICKVENGKFDGKGGPEKLQEMLSVFLSWAKSNA